MESGIPISTVLPVEPGSNLQNFTVIEEVQAHNGSAFLKAIRPGDPAVYLIAIQRHDDSVHMDTPEACNTVQQLAERMEKVMQEKTQAEEKIRRQERFYKGLLENAFDCVLVKDGEGKVCYASPGIRAFGYEPDEVIGKNGFEFFHPDEMVQLEDAYKTLQCEQGQTTRSIHRIQFHDGQYRTLEVIGRNMLHDEAIKGFIINFRDITDQQRTENELAQKEKYFRALIEHSSDVTSLVDENVKFRYVSPAVERMLGYSPEEILQVSGADLVHPDDAERVRQSFQAILKRPGSLIKEEFRCRRKNGYYIDLEVILNNLLGDEAIRGIVVNSREITERKEAERLLLEYNETLQQEVQKQTKSLVRKNKELEKILANLQNAQMQLVESEKMASLGQLTAGIAHEINNPINFVSANVGPLKADLEDLRQLLNRYTALHQSEQLREDLKEINRFREEIDMEYLESEIDALLNGIEEGASRTKEIVIGLRNFSRLDELDLKTVNIHDGLNSTVMLLRSKLKNRIQVVKEYGDLPEIECYPGKLNQVFMNILSNAIAAIPGEGTITIRTWLAEGNVHVSIKDTGTGMTDKVKRRIFDPFFTTKEVGEGTGLGLSISYGIIQKHNGKIDVFSEPGLGSEFVITLPVKQAV